MNRYTVISTELPNCKSTRGVTIDIDIIDYEGQQANEYEIALYYHREPVKIIADQQGLSYEECLELYNLCMQAVVIADNEEYRLVEIKSIIELFKN